MVECKSTLGQYFQDHSSGCKYKNTVYHVIAIDFQVIYILDIY